MAMYDANGQPAYCGNCVWGQLVSIFRSEPDPFGRITTTGGQVLCQLNPKRGDFGFPVMEYTDHCSHHPALSGLIVDGFAKSTLPITIPRPVPDWLRGECPTCGAEPGEDCNKAVRGRRRNGVHLLREDAAWETMWRTTLPGCPYCGVASSAKCVGPGGAELHAIHYAREKVAADNLMQSGHIRNQ